MSGPVTGLAPLDWILGLLDTFGYPIVLVATALENVFVVGSFTPGETIVLATAFTAANDHLEVILVWFLSILGTVIGSNISFFLGVRGGRGAVERYGHRFHISDARIAAAEEYFQRHGAKTVLIARFAAGVKNFVPMLAGVSKMSVALFEFYTVLGALVYTTVLVSVGWFFGENFDAALEALRDIGFGALVLLAVGAGLAFWGRWRRKQRDRELAEAHDEGDVAGGAEGHDEGDVAGGAEGHDEGDSGGSGLGS